VALDSFVDGMDSAELDDLVRRVTRCERWADLVRLIASGVYAPRLVRDKPDDAMLGAELERAGLCVYWRRDHSAYRRRLDSEDQPPSSR
jgi:hypothetical protein